MHRMVLIAAGFLVLAPPAFAQQPGNGWGGALDQLNRAVNPDTYPQDRDNRDAPRDGRRMEGSSDDNRGGTAGYRRYSDRDLRDQYDRLIDEQRQMQRDRRAMEEEFERRGIRR